LGQVNWIRDFKRLDKLKIKQKLMMLVTIIVAGFVVFGVMSLSILSYLKVNGPIYSDIVSGKDLVADILPPPEYIIESYLVVNELLVERDAVVLDQKITYLKDDLEKAYYDRHNYWLENLSDGELKTKMTQDSFTPADEFFKIVDNEFIPAIQAHDWQKARQIAYGKLKLKYETHRKYIDDAVAMANQNNAELERSSSISIIAGVVVLIGFALIIVLVSVHFFKSVANKIVDKIHSTRDMLGVIASGDLTQRIQIDNNSDDEDELDELSRSFNGFADEFEKLINVIAKNSDHLADTSDTLSASSQEVNALSEQMAATVQEIATGRLGLSKICCDSKNQSDVFIESVKEVATLAKRSAESAQEVDDFATKGGESAKIAGEKMETIKEMVSSSAEAVKELGDKSKQINKVIEVINGISEQTNLLALNAAIEAARAGDAGKGFAVVADEVMKLAEESRKATEQIKNMVEEITKSTEDAIQVINSGTGHVEESGVVVNEALASLDTMSGKVKELTNQINQIRESTEAQLDSTGSVHDSMETVHRMEEDGAAATEEVAATVEETTNAIQQVSNTAQVLSTNADELKHLISRFKVRDSESAA
jgi:methyl-accepting chemotaxis protein